MTPALVTLTVPNWFVRLIPSAQAAIGNSRAHKPNTTEIRFILLPPPQKLSVLFQQTLGGASRRRLSKLPEHLPRHDRVPVSQTGTQYLINGFDNCSLLYISRNKREGYDIVRNKFK